MPSSAGTSTKKRKRDASPSEDKVSFEVSSASSSGAVGPVLVSFPALQAPESTPFKCYAPKRLKTNKETEKDGEGGYHDRMLVVGETPAVEFVSNEEETARAADAGCRYLLAVHNPRTSKITLLPASKTPFILTRTVKALKSIAPSETSALAFREARTALGETFGTKKAKAAIRAQERNRVDIGAMKGVMQYVTDGIDKGAEGLLTTEEAKELSDSTRLVPPFSATATDPADIYSLHDIIPEIEWKAINVAPLEQAGSRNEQQGYLPYRYSEWVNNHLKALASEKVRSKKQKLKILFYISAMILFRRIASHPGGIQKDDIYGKMSSVPPIVVDGMLSRFTETSRDSTAHKSTSAMNTKFLAYLLALCLRVDEWATNPKHLAEDLSISMTNVTQALKSLGCKLKPLGERERAKHGLSDTLADTKFAVLTAPVQFPKVRQGKRK